MNPVDLLDMVLHYQQMISQLIEEMYDCTDRMKKISSLIEVEWKGGTAERIREKTEDLLWSQNKALEKMEQAERQIRFFVSSLKE